MGLFSHEAANRAVDSSGAGIRNAVRCIYPKGSNTLAPLYRDPDLTEQLTSDMRSDENGYFALCYLQDGEYRVEIRAPHDDRTVLYSAEDILVGSETPAETQRDYRTLDSLVADRLLSYSAGTGRLRVWPGMRVRISATGTQFCVLPEGGAAQVTTAGGVRLCETGTRFTSEARFVEAVARGDHFSTGTTVLAGGAVYTFLGDGNTDLPGLTGWRRVVSQQNAADLGNIKAKTDLVAVSQPVNLDVVPALASAINTYDSVAAGLAATASGASFFVMAGPGLQVYRNDAGSETFLGWHGEIGFETVADLLAATTALPVGVTLNARREGFHYQVAATAATDHHLTTAGGVKLYVQPGAAGRYNVMAFGAKCDGTTDDSAAVQAAIDLGKAQPGVTIYFPRGTCRIAGSIDCTYTGSAAGLSTGYYGFTLEGSDPFNTVLLCQSAGRPTFDFSGKPRMTLRNLGFQNFTDGAHNPSCMLLLARNLTNSYAGGHFIERCLFRGYANETLVQTASSETNMWVKCDFEPFRQNCSGIEVTGQIETGVTSEYIDFTGHVFSGGNTWQVFTGCAFNNSVPTLGTHAVRVSEADIVTFDTCYSHSRGDATFLFGPTSNSNVKFINHRHESNSTGEAWWMDFAANMDCLEISGRSSRAIRARDGVRISNSRIAPQYIARGAAAYSLDAYDLLDCDVSGMTNEVRVRNSARGSRFHDVKPASQWVLPSGDTTAPEVYWLGYSGGASNYRRKVEYRGRNNRHELGRLHISRLVVPLTVVNPASGSQTPDLDVAGAYQFVLSGNLTIANPANVDLGPSDPRGQRLTIVIVQDATGGRTVSWGNQFDLQGAVVDTAPNAQTVFDFVFISSNANKPWCRVR